MMQTVNLKDAEKQVFRLATFDDGLWEICLGLFFMLMSTYSLSRALLGPVWNAVFVLGVYLSMVGVAWMVKKSITQPRIGHVRLGAPVQRKIRIAHILTWALVLATFVLVILGAMQLIHTPTWEQFPQWLNEFAIDLLFALLLVVLFGLAAYATGVSRFYFYGLLLGAGNFLTVVLRSYNDLQFGWPLFLAGLIVAVSGVFVLMRFMQTHPGLPEETTHDRP
jgi:hypothetical protein